MCGIFMPMGNTKTDHKWHDFRSDFLHILIALSTY